MTQPQIIPLWNEDELGKDGLAWSRPEEIANLADGLEVIRNVTTPTLTAYLPEAGRATGTAVIVAPGGAYHFLAYHHEGIQVAHWLNARGIAAFMLKYRLIQTGDDFPECIGKNMSNRKKFRALCNPLFPLINADGCKAVQVVRGRSAEWGIDPHKIGIMGFSAGGFVTLMTALNYDAASRPDFAAPIYAAPPLKLPVPPDAPPLFLCCAADDDMASGVSTRMYAAWRKARRPVEMHIYAQGGHGFGMNPKGLPSDTWIERFYDWLKGQQLA